mmetsp:Transcript_18350/g.33252  ORF Transcript_18350/g.33252 Transcript_18350/m.33252 type:complete len:114 (+) Transcript_18350:69-410(+)
MMVSVKLDPKVYFSVERTFLHWARLAAILAASAVALAANANNMVSGLGAVLVAVAASILLCHSIRRHNQRLSALAARTTSNKEEFGDRKGAKLVAACTTLATVGVVVCTALSY